MGNSSGKPVVLTDEVNLNHFRLLRVVGKGAFGKVRIVERKDSGLTFALKYIRKDEGMCHAATPTAQADPGSGTVGIRTQHHQGKANARTPQPSFSLQFTV